MNIDELKILELLRFNNKITQRELAIKLHFSLGKVNKLLNVLRQYKFIDGNLNFTNSAKEYMKSLKPRNAIILAAGYGFRMIPINSQMNKAFIEVKEEVLVERLINQLHSMKIYDITIVVGYMKEQFDYLIDKYNVRLVVNMNYMDTNSLYSLSLVKQNIGNSYILPCDLYFNKNPFSTDEFYSWYMLSNEYDSNSFFKMNVSNRLAISNSGGNKMIGLSYITHNDAKRVVEKIDEVLVEDNLNAYYEVALKNNNKCLVDFKLIHSTDVMEFNTYEDLQAFDYMSSSLQIEIINIIKKTLNIEMMDILNIKALKTGMTNRSFLFECRKKKYIMRIPGEGTDLLIKRKEEKHVYDIIEKYNLSDKVLYFNENTGYKITEFIENAHNCDCMNIDEVKKCMIYLRRFHEYKIKTDHIFDIFEKIEYYEMLRDGRNSIYKDYSLTKENIYKIKKYIDLYKSDYVLCHIDSVPDNFLLYNINCKEEIRLIDWEYSAMQDPDIDIAMFAIYAMYDRNEIDMLINLYYNSNCNQERRIKIYCYIACCGLLWSNWCEYKSSLGIEFGEYSMRQYRYAKDYYRIVNEMLGDELNVL